jgi:plastocyanin
VWPCLRLVAVLGAVAAALAFASDGHAVVQTLTFRHGPVEIKPYVTAEQLVPVASPGVDGFVTGIDVEIVDRSGHTLGYRDIMLHHVVLANALRRDTVCSSYKGFTGERLPFAPERFFGVGEERYRLELPRGFGYPNQAGDVWGMAYMLMNHRPRTLDAYIQYTVRYVTGESLTPVKPLWLDIRNCRVDPIWDVPGTGAPGSRYTRSVGVRLPLSGRIVAAGAHLHGGGISLNLSNATCESSLFTSWPTWGYVSPKPVLHETGPSHMSSFRSEEGIPASEGDVLRLTAAYDNSLPHTRVMGIMLGYLAPGPAPRCAPVPPLRLDLGAPGPPPLAAMPLPRAPRGVLNRTDSSWVGDYRFSNERVSVTRGTRYTWKFAGPTPHNVTLANGPIGFSSPTLERGSFTFRFARPGVYRLFCSLHPVAMVQTITVSK